MIITDSGHFRTREEDEKQAEDRQSRQAADIRITFLEAIAGERLPQRHRDIAEKLVTAPKLMTPPPLIFSSRGPTGK